MVVARILNMEKNAFTLIELLFTLTVIGIIATLSMVSSSHLIHKNEQQTIIDELKSAVQYAKIQALRLGKPVYLLPVDKQLNWSHGVKLILLNRNTNTQDLLYQLEWHHPHWSLVWSGMYSPNRIVFYSTPIKAISNGRFTLTNLTTKEQSILVVNRLGRVRLA